MNTYKISIKFGIFTAVILTLYFLVLGWLGVNSNPFYSFANALIVTVGLSLAIRELKKESSGQISYQRGFKTAFTAGVIATIVFSIFFITYYSYVPEFEEGLREKIGEFASTGGIFITVVVMGLGTSLTVAFVLMQLHKMKLNRNPAQDEDSFFIKEVDKNKKN